MRNYRILKNAMFAKAGECFAPVTLPHTWNAQDGQDGGNDFWRGVGTYIIDLPDPTAGKRQYIEPVRYTMWRPSGVTDGSWVPIRAAFPPSVTS